jgi:hypothetical protein
MPVTYVKDNCPQCGAEFERKLGHYNTTIKRGGINYCGIVCANRAKMLKRAADNKMTEEKFWSKVDKTPGQGPNGDCWIWTGNRNHNNYGFLSWPDRCRDRSGHNVMAHRTSFEFVKGVIDEGLCILHSCDNPPCVNPAHLSADTHQKNLEEAKERNRYPKGERSYRTNLTNEQAREIKLLSLLGYSRAHIGRLFNIKPSVITRMMNNQTWVSVVVTREDLILRPDLLKQAAVDRVEGGRDLFDRSLWPTIAKERKSAIR